MTGPNRTFCITIHCWIEGWEWRMTIQFLRTKKSHESSSNSTQPRKPHGNWALILWTSNIATATWAMNFCVLTRGKGSTEGVLRTGHDFCAKSLRESAPPRQECKWVSES